MNLSRNISISSFYFFVLFFTFKTTEGQIKEISAEENGVVNLRVDPSIASGGNTSDIFDDIKYIPLETNNECKFGKISQLEYVDGHYIILDPETNSILIFTENGKFVSKIKRRKDVPIIKFSINKWYKNIIFVDDNFRSVSFYDFKGNFIRKQENTDLNVLGIFALNFEYIGAETVLSYDTYRDFKVGSKYFQPFSRSLIRFAKGNGSVFANGFLYNDIDAKIDVLYGATNQLTNFGIDTARFFVKPYTFDIYTITPNAIAHNYHITLPVNISLPSDFLTNKVYTNKHAEFIKSHPNLIYRIDNCYKIKDNFLFKASSLSSYKEDNLILNLVSGSLIAYKHITPDWKSFYLPIFDSMTSGFENYGIGYCDGINIFTWLTSFKMLEAFNGNKELNPKYDSALSKYFSKATKDSNPVIVRLRLKNEL